MRIKKRMLNFALLKEWIQRNQIAVINTSVTISLLLVAIIVLLLRTGALQRNAVEEGVINLTGMTAYEAQVFYMSYFDKARTLAQIMASYQNIEVTQRRHIFNTIKLEILQANEALINVYSVWRPYGLDGLDAQFAGTPGHDETGQYISGFTRRFGPVQPRFFGDFVFLLGLSFEHLGLGGIISEPIFKDVAGTETWVVDVQVPIVDGEYIIGLAGVTINLMHLQNMIEGRSPHGGQTMISTSAGNILAHNDREMRGFSFFRPDPRNPLITNETFQFVRNSLITMEPHVFS
ncbi:MAG: hypothetical protein FWC34_00020, partial [Bacteroidetes bacterium]|nr:hypothetical protein [Bacteroidota bacterium]